MVSKYWEAQNLEGRKFGSAGKSRSAKVDLICLKLKIILARTKLKCTLSSMSAKFWCILPSTNFKTRGQRDKRSTL